MNRFDLQSKLNQATVINRIRSMINGEKISPIVIDFDCTTQCNFACEYCISKSYLGNCEFSKDDLRLFANAFSNMGVKAVILTGGGEPLLNSNIDFFIETLICGTPPISVGLVTNGFLLNEHLETIKNISWVRISVDAAKQSTFFAIKKVDCFTKIIDNIAALNETKRCNVGYSFLIAKNTDGTNNINEIFEAAQLAKKIGCDYFECKIQFDDAHRSIGFTDTEIFLIKEEIHRAIDELTEENFSIYANSNASLILENKFSETSYASTNTCQICRLRTVVSPLGLFACSYYRGNMHMKYGESNPLEFEKIWNSKHFDDFVSKIVPSQHCRFHCARDASNHRLCRLLTEKETMIHMIPDSDLFI